jgi:hypothetical protein
MSSWSDSLLRSAQFWMFYLSIGVPLLGVLAGGFCAIVKDRAEHEIIRRQEIAGASKEGLEAERRQAIEGDLRAQLEQANQRARELAERPATEGQTPPRSITAAQRAKFIDLLEFSPKGPVRVNVMSGVDAETTAYARQIHEMVASAGYEAGDAIGVKAGGQIPEGVFMVVGHTKHPFAGAMQQAFSMIGINATGLIDDSIPGDEVRVEVGQKP